MTLKQLLVFLSFIAFVLAAVLDGTGNTLGMTPVGYIAAGLAAYVLAKIIPPATPPA